MVPHTLRIADLSSDSELYRFEIALEDAGATSKTAECEFSIALSAEDQERLRWYWEDYLDYPVGTNRTIAAEIEERLAEIGSNLFTSIFESEAALHIWQQVRPRLLQTRIEITTKRSSQSALLPWELLRDPHSGVLLAAACAAFVRRPASSKDKPVFPEAGKGPLRVLLLACRPSSDREIPFRSTARRLVQALGAEKRREITLEILRPPTFAQLTNVLLEAEATGEPYHLLQVDAHGIYANIESDGVPQHLEEGAGTHSCTRVLSGAHGYLIFNNPVAAGSLQLVDGRSLGELMQQARVPLLALNACSASGTPFGQGPWSNPAAPATQVKLYDSLAQDAMTDGVAGVLALPYNLDTDTSAQYLLRTYSWLAQGLPLGRSATMQRKRLQNKPDRQISLGPVRRDDWPTMLVYESRPRRLIRSLSAPPVDLSDQDPGESQWLYANAPHQPPSGFCGVEDTLLAMDSAWHTHSVILLQGGAGLGKTLTAAEFARWCRKTGAAEGPVLYTSFEQYQPLASLLDQLAGVFWEALSKAGFQWEVLSTEDRTDVALHVLKHIPVLWIWDCVERISGYPRPGEPPWSRERRHDLMEFLLDAEATPARFVLISRQGEGNWLDEFCVKIQAPGLPMRERFQLARQVAERQERRFEDVEDWRPLLEYSRGIPLVIHCLAVHVLAEGIRSRKQIEELVGRVRGLELPVEDDLSDGLEEPLRATLDFVLRSAFRKGERKLLALLHLFRTTVGKDLFLQLKEFDREQERETQEEHHEVEDLMEVFGSSLLDRLATAGLLIDQGKGFYAIQRALVPFLRNLFHEYFPGSEERDPFASRPAGTSSGVPAELPPMEAEKTDSTEEPQGEVTATPKDLPDEEQPESKPAATPEAATTRGGAAERGKLASLASRFHKRDLARNASRAFVATMSRYGTACFRRAQDGDQDVIAELDTHEPNLLHAIRLAGEYEWWDFFPGLVNALGTLYEAAGRIARWKDLVELLTPQCTEVASQAPLPGREEYWRALTGVNARLAYRRQRLHAAEALQSHCARWDRQQAEPYLETPVSELDAEQRAAVRTLADSLFRLGEILRGQGQGREATRSDEEAIALREKLGNKQGAAEWARQLGMAYTEVLGVRDLLAAERWLRRSYDLLEEQDTGARARCLGLLGRVAWERFNEARNSNQPERDLIRHLNSARRYYQRALEQDPPDDHASRAQHNQELGHVCYALGDLDRALPYYRESIRHAEQEGSVLKASQTRFDLAIALRDTGRLHLARRYAQEACRDFEQADGADRTTIARAQRLVELIDRKLPREQREPAVLVEH